MKASNLRYIALLISLLALTGSAAFASDTLSDAMNLIRSGVSEDVVVAWAARQPPLEPTKEAMDTLIQAKVSGRVAQALLLGNTRPASVPQKSSLPAKPVEKAVMQQVQPEDDVVIQPAAQDSTVVVDGGVTYYPDTYYGWPYSYWPPYWAYGSYGYGWPYWRGGWRNHDRWQHGDWHNGNHDARHDGVSGYHYGSGLNNIRHEQAPSQALPQSQTHAAAQNRAATPHQSYSSGANSHVYSGTVYSHSSGGEYSGGHSSGGGGHGFGGGGHGGGRR